MSDFELLLDEDNELKFNVAVEGSAEGSVKSRFIISKASGFDLCFEGRSTSSGEVEVDVHSLKGILKEGDYKARLEVLVDDRIFIPLNMLAYVKQSIKVEAAMSTTKVRSKTKVAAAIISEHKPVVKSVKKLDTVTQNIKPRAKIDYFNSLDDILAEIESI